MAKTHAIALAALVSTIDTNLNVVATAVNRFLDSKVHRPKTEFVPNRYRVVTLIIGFIGLLASLIIADIVALIVAAASILLVMLPQVLVLLFSKREVDATAKFGYFLSLLAGAVVMFAIFVFADPTIAFLPAFAVSGFGTLLVFLLRRTRKTSEGAKT